MTRWLIIWLLSTSLPAPGQDFPRREIDLEKLTDEFFALQDKDLNYQELYENLVQLLANPLDLNTATEEQLRALFVLDEPLLRTILEYRQRQGPFLSVYELQSIPGFTRDLFLKRIPFVAVRDATQTVNRNLCQRMSTEDNHYLILRSEQVLERRVGFLSTDSLKRFAGPLQDFYMRYRLARPGDFSFGFTADHDAGEPFRWQNGRQYGFDFWSVHGQLMNKGRVKNLIIGDFQAQFGQGLALGGAFGLGKNAESVTTVRRSNLGFLPYTSLSEAGFFRGMALSYAVFPKVTVHAFGSSAPRDAQIANDNDRESGNFSSIYFTGLHRSAQEQDNRHTLREQNAGLVVQARSNALDAGIYWHHTNFGLSLQRTTNVYNGYYFNGSQNDNVGFFVNYSWQNFVFFSEAVQSIGAGRAITGGLLTSVSAKVDLAIVARKFDRNYHSFYANALSENSTPQNESGFYWGIKVTPSRKISGAGYVDLFRFPWLRYRAYRPSAGYEWLLRFNWQPTRHIFVFLQAREEQKERNLSQDSPLYQTGSGVKRNYWINVDYGDPKIIRFKTRLQFSEYDLAKTTRGFAVIQDISARLGRVTLSGRYALFDTDDYDNRLYVYEKDVWLAFSFPAYFGVGVRHYLLAEYAINKRLTAYLRWAKTRFSDRTQIGSGSDLIDGNERNEIKCQLLLKL
ncbi:MAG TPA: hypothetical protein DCE81_00430 [Cytophagales bacterium]|nr:hypothetical protein [Cytophagales bacterium]